MEVKGAVLIPIGMQQAFDGPTYPERWNTKLDMNVQALISTWREAGRTIIHVRHDALDPESSLVAGKPGHAFREGCEPADGEVVIAKHYDNAFAGTDLDIRLRKMRVNVIMLCGMPTDTAISSTARTGNDLGYQVTVISDACDSFEIPDGGEGINAKLVHRIHIATLRQDIARISPTASVLEAIRKRSGGGG